MQTESGVVAGSSAVAEALMDDWRKPFSKVPDKVEMKKSLMALREHVPDLAEMFAEIQPPGSYDFLCAAQFARPSAPGVDGIPHAGWAFLLAACTLCELFFDIVDGVLPTLEFIFFRLIFSFPKAKKLVMIP